MVIFLNPLSTYLLNERVAWSSSVNRPLFWFLVNDVILYLNTRKHRFSRNLLSNSSEKSRSRDQFSGAPFCTLNTTVSSQKLMWLLSVLLVQLNILVIWDWETVMSLTYGLFAFSSFVIRSDMRNFNNIWVCKPVWIFVFLLKDNLKHAFVKEVVL